MFVRIPYTLAFANAGKIGCVFILGYVKWYLNALDARDTWNAWNAAWDAWIY